MKTNKWKILNKLFNHAVYPAIFSIASGNIAPVINTIVAGNFLGENSLAAIGICTPIVNILSCFAFIMIYGINVLVPIDLGRHKINMANYRISVGVVFGTIISLLFMLLVYIFLEPLGMLLSGSDINIAKEFNAFMKPYLIFLMIGTPFLAAPNVVRTLGDAKLSSIMSLTTIISIIVFDIIFVKVFNLGIFGISLSTIIGYLSILPISILFIKKNTIIKFIFPKHGAMKIIKDNAVAGTPDLVSKVILNSIYTFANLIVVGIFGTEGLVIQTIVFQMLTIVCMFVWGYRDAFQIVGGLVYGEQSYDEFYYVHIKDLKYSTITTFICTLLILLFPVQIAMFFGCEDSLTLEMAQSALRISSLILIPFFFVQAYTTVFQIESRYKVSTIFSGGSMILTCILMLIINFTCPQYYWWTFPVPAILFVFVLFMYSGFICKSNRSLRWPSLIDRKMTNQIVVNYNFLEENFIHNQNKLLDFFIVNKIPKNTINKIFLCIEAAQYNISKQHNKYPIIQKPTYQIKCVISKVLLVTVKDNLKSISLVTEAINNPALESAINLDNPELNIIKNIAKNLNYFKMGKINILKTEFEIKEN